MLLSFMPNKKPTRVVFFGDSITEAGVIPGGYIAQMRDSLTSRKINGKYELIGSGIGGNKVYDLFLRLEEDVLKRKPNVVVLYVGVNDVWHRQMFGTGTDADKFQKFYIALIQKLKSKGIKVIACTPACIGERPGGLNPLDAELDRFAAIIRQVATDTDTPVCDLRQAFMAYESLYNRTEKTSGILTTDGVHLNDNGNKLVAEILMDRLLELK
ncbi:MAG: G-D-S-L family lipolytic protein [Saprospiraceae bacterium]|nr:G-D-S-L family lipolytic protein [Saprospiraceae bacterium]